MGLDTKKGGGIQSSAGEEYINLLTDRDLG